MWHCQNGVYLNKGKRNNGQNALGLIFQWTKIIQWTTVCALSFKESFPKLLQGREYSDYKLTLCLARNESCWNVLLSLYEKKQYFKGKRKSPCNLMISFGEPSFREMTQGKEQPLHSDITTRQKVNIGRWDFLTGCLKKKKGIKFKPRGSHMPLALWVEGTRAADYAVVE